jgi:curved DNA-binding protein CbpA
MFPHLIPPFAQVTSPCPVPRAHQPQLPLSSTFQLVSQPRLFKFSSSIHQFEALLMDDVPQSEHADSTRQPNEKRTDSNTKLPPPTASTHFVCFYDILSVDPTSCTKAQVKSAYKREALIWHPDKNPNDPEGARQRFLLVAEAYEILSDDIKRQQYDRLRFAPPPPIPGTFPTGYTPHTSNGVNQPEQMDAFDILLASLGRIDPLQVFDSIVGGFFETLQRTASAYAARNSPSPAFWTCTICTLENNPEAYQCNACLNPRGIPRPPPPRPPPPRPIPPHISTQSFTSSASLGTPIPGSFPQTPAQQSSQGLATPGQNSGQPGSLQDLLSLLSGQLYFSR